jgi:protein gp37
MGKDTAIAWTHHTFNPWWGCVKVAPECANCYAETFAKRTGHKVFGPGGARRFFKDSHWDEPLAWNRAAAEAGERRRVFCGSMCDVFDVEVDESWRMRLWGLIESTPHLDWLLLTKRPRAAQWCMPAAWSLIRDRVWLGLSLGSLTSLRESLDPFLALDAGVRFLSMEPLIERVVLPAHALVALDWIIVGGESGPKARPMDAEWARALLAQSRTAGVHFFMKQLGGFPDKRERLDEFPEDLRVREFPR